MALDTAATIRFAALVAEAREAWDRDDRDMAASILLGVFSEADDSCAIAAGPWPEADPEIEAAKNAVVMEMMGVGDIDLRAKRIITALWQRGWRPTNGT